MSAYLPSTVMERRPQLVTVESPREAERSRGKVEIPGWDFLLPVLTSLMVIFGFGQGSTASSLCQVCLQSR